MSKVNEFIETMFLEADVVVRVEVASVSLAARDFGELAVGDVLETDVRLKEPAVLRVHGREVARGELVSVDGRVGVRVTELLTRD